MFFDNLEEIPKLATSHGCSIFVVPNETIFNFPDSSTTIIRPGETGKTGIVIDQIRDIISHVNNKQKSKQYIIIYEAELMNLQATNAFLKNLEEPKANYHYILQTETPSALVPTVLSRSAIFILKKNQPLDSAVNAPAEVKDYAKKLISCNEKNLVSLAEEIAKSKKDGAREFVLQILKVAIQISYKSYFKTNNPTFVKKADSLISAYEAILANGNIKLHLVADML